jgi:uncharacterized membrane protein
MRKRAAHPTSTMLARCIEEVESRTEAEVVLVVRRASGSYRDVDFAVGAGLAFAVLLFKLFSPWEFDPLSIPLPLIFAFALGARASQALGVYGPRRYLTTAQRRERQVHAAAAACFLDKGVDRVPSRAGILLYFSATEQRAELICGEKARAALEASQPSLGELRARLTQACSSRRTIHGSVEQVAGFLRSLGVLLGQVLPCQTETRRNVLDNAPDLGAEGGEPHGEIS